MSTFNAIPRESKRFNSSFKAQSSTLDCLIHKQGLISAQGGIYQKINKRTGPNNCTGWKNFRDLKIAAQGLIIAQGKNNYKE